MNYILITAARNEEAFIERTICSVIAQTSLPERWIIVDDGSTDRTEVWADALKPADNPILGAGFESFWLGPRLDVLWAKWWWQPNQAHNGYIETYLNLGMVGVILLLAMVVATFMKIRSDLLRNFQFGRLRMAFLVVILIYSFTEATFKGVHLVWTAFHLIAIDYPRFGKLSQRNFLKLLKTGEKSRNLQSVCSKVKHVSLTPVRNEEALIGKTLDMVVAHNGWIVFPSQASMRLMSDSSSFSLDARQPPQDPLRSKRYGCSP